MKRTELKTQKKEKMRKRINTQRKTNKKKDPKKKPTTVEIDPEEKSIPFIQFFRWSFRFRCWSDFIFYFIIF